ncbi:Flagellar biosynthetic protein FlhB [Gammaproteobacteria bacterium]
MAEDSDQEKTEAATPKKVEEARRQGQVPRSRELNTLVVTLTASLGLWIYGHSFVASLSDLMRRGFTLTKEQVYDPLWLVRMFRELVLTALWDLTPLLLMLVASAIIAPLLIGGWSFSMESLGFKWDRLNPFEGLKRMFNSHGLKELGKTLLKFTLMALVGFWFLRRYSETILILGRMDLFTAVGEVGDLLTWGFVVLAIALAVVAAGDAPLQLWEYAQGLKMTRQEVRDEVKETEGRPEVKGRIRQLQREMAQKRMMTEVPKADVVLTNPTHYAVALKYDVDKMGAPRVVAKGADLVAKRILEIAAKEKVLQVIAPALTRALYYSTELNREIPQGLYQAVAQVLAFVYQVRKGKPAPGPNAFDDVPIPEKLRR